MKKPEITPMTIQKAEVVLDVIIEYIEWIDSEQYHFDKRPSIEHHVLYSIIGTVVPEFNEWFKNRRDD